MGCRFTTVSALGLGFGLLGGCSSAGGVNFFDTEAAGGARGNPTSAGASSGSSAAPDMAHGGSAGALIAPSTLAGGAGVSGAGGGGAILASGGLPALDSAGAPATAGAAGAASDLPCGPVIDITDTKSKAGTELGTEGPVCFLVRDEIAGWGCSNFQGRKVKVNGVEVHCAELPLPDKLNDGYYFDVSSGEHTYASLYWY